MLLYLKIGEIKIDVRLAFIEPIRDFSSVKRIKNPNA